MWWLALAAMLGCSDGDEDVDVVDTDVISGDDSDAPPGPALSFDDYCAEAIDLYVDRLDVCFPGMGYAAGDEGGDAFRAQLVEECLVSKAAADAGRATFDGAAAASCLASARALAGVCTWDFAGFLDPSCADVLTPAVPVGGACTSAEGRLFLFSGTCADGWCDDGDSCPGACAPYAALGESCAAVPCDPDEALCVGEVPVCVPATEPGDACPTGACGAGQRCVDGVCFAVAVPGDTCGDERVCVAPAFQCQDGVCDLHVPDGGACLFTLNCQGGSVCRDGDGDGATTCEPPAAVGERCALDQDCAADAWCDADVGRCAARGAYADDCSSAPCADGLWCWEPGKGVPSCERPRSQGEGCWEWYGPSLDEHACTPGSLCMDDGDCHPIGGVGDPCAVTRASCQPGLTCDRATVTCQERGAVDAACNPFDAAACADGLGCACTGTDRQCRSDLTVEAQPWHTCQPLEVDGGPCWSWGECASGLCDPCADGDCDGPGVCMPVPEACTL